MDLEKTERNVKKAEEIVLDRLFYLALTKLIFARSIIAFGSWGYCLFLLNVRFVITKTFIDKGSEEQSCVL